MSTFHFEEKALLERLYSGTSKTPSTCNPLGIVRLTFVIIGYKLLPREVRLDIQPVSNGGASLTIFSPEVHEWLVSKRCPITQPGYLTSIVNDAEQLCDLIHRGIKIMPEPQRRISSCLYEAFQLCQNQKCRGFQQQRLEEKTSESGISSLLCKRCGVVQREDLFSGVSQSERSFEEDHAKQVQAQKWHRMKHSGSAGYRETQLNLYRYGRKSVEEKKTEKLTRHSVDALLRKGCVVISAVLAERARKDPEFTQDAVPLEACTSETPERMKARFLQRVEGLDALKDAVISCIQRDWTTTGALSVLSSTLLETFLEALRVFYNLRVTNELAQSEYKSKKIYTTALCSAVYAIRKYDERLSEKRGCCLHTLDDFCADKTYVFEVRKPALRLRLNAEKTDFEKRRDPKFHPIHVPPYRSFSAEYSKFLNLVDPSSLDLHRAHHIEQMVKRVLNDLRFVVFTDPMQSIQSAEEAMCYMYRIRSRARVMAYWEQIKSTLTVRNLNTKQGELGRNLLKHFELRENLLIASVIVYCAFRVSSKITTMHAWPERVIQKMEILREEERSAVIPPGKDFVALRKEEYSMFASETTATTETEKQFAEVASNMIQELDLYETYRNAIKTYKRVLTDRDTGFLFNLRWLAVIFHISEKRMADCAQMLPKISTHALSRMQRQSEEVLGLSSGKDGILAKLEEKMRQLRQHSTVSSSSSSTSSSSSSGVVCATTLVSKYKKRAWTGMEMKDREDSLEKRMKMETVKQDEEEVGAMETNSSV